MSSVVNKRANGTGWCSLLRNLTGEEIIFPYVPEDQIKDVARFLSVELKKRLADGKLEPVKGYVPRTFKIVATIAALFFLASSSALAAVSDAQVDSIVRTIIAAESSGRAWVVGDGGKARGLMQIQRETWERYTGESWDRAFEPALNKAVGTKIVRDIAKRYGSRATAARIIFTYNTGRWAKEETLPSWTRRHPNNVYREVFTKGGLS